MRENKELLKINDLVVEYQTKEDGTVQALNGVNLTLNRGETIGLVGETGAGKTTLAKSILRVLPDPPAKIMHGSIEFEGKDLLKISEPEMRKIRGNKISMIFQDPMTALNPTMKVGRQIADAIRLHEKISKADAEIRAVKMLEMVGIPGERFGEYPHQFSGGMKQRVVIAMALACKPDLLLSDEATTALDVTIQAQVLDMIMNLKKELNTSVVMITHDLGIVAETCDKVAIVYAGEIVEYGTTQQIYDSPQHPYTIGLFGSLPSLTAKEKRLHPIPGLMPDPTDLPQGCKFCERCPHAEEKCRKENSLLKDIGDGHTVRCHKITGEKV